MKTGGKGFFGWNKFYSKYDKLPVKIFSYAALIASYRMI